MPHDAFRDDPEGVSGESADAIGAPIVSLPHKDPSANPPARPPRPKSGAAKPRRPASAKAPAFPAKAPADPVKAVVDPGPPPPLPADLVVPPVPPLPGDLVIPPRPPLPAVAVAGPAAPAPDAEIVAADLVEADPAQPTPTPEPAPEPEPEPQPVLEPKPAPVLTEDAAAPLPAPAEPLPATEERPAESAPLAEPDEVVPPAAPELEHPDPFAASVILDGPADAAPPALVIRGASKRFGDTRAVDGIDLTVPAGIFYGLVGPNGAGKTTTLSLIAGLLRPDKGSIRIAGVDAASDPTGAKRLMGVLPDRLRTFDRLTGRQLLYYYGVLRGLPSATVESRIGDLARAFDLTDALGRSVADYSAGMSKKVMLAGALIHSPRLLVLDEPFESVDPVSSAVILDILSAYVAHGGTVILSSHGMEFVERVCTRVAVMVAGQVLAEGTVDEVRGELTLEQRFVELAGGLSDVEGLEWLHTFSD